MAFLWAAALGSTAAAIAFHRDPAGMDRVVRHARAWLNHALLSLDRWL